MEISSAMQHASVDPTQLFMIACRNNCADCSTIPPSRLGLANYYHDNWNGRPLPLVDVKLAKGGVRYMGAAELEQLPLPERQEYQNSLPPAFDRGHQRCNFCHFFGDKSTHLARHVNGAHPGKNLADCFPRPFTCLYQPPRKTNANGIPFGPPNPRCLETFPTRAKLDSHKTIHPVQPKAKKTAPAEVQEPVGVAPQAAPPAEVLAGVPDATFIQV